MELNRDKQIEEMRKFVSKIPYLTLNQDQENLLSQYFVNEGFCKASEVAREIFEEIKKLTHTKWDWTDCVEWDAIAELEKKYTEEGK